MDFSNNHTRNWVLGLRYKIYLCREFERFGEVDRLNDGERLVDGERLGRYFGDGERRNLGDGERERRILLERSLLFDWRDFQRSSCSFR